MTLLLGALLGTGALVPAGGSHTQDGEHVQGGATFETATPLDPAGLYHAELDSSGDHYFRFHVELGDPINIEFRPFCNTRDCPMMHSGSLPAPDNQRRLAFRLLSPDGAVLDTANTNQGDARVMISAAPMTGEYRLHVSNSLAPISGHQGPYSFCFLRPPQEEHPCPDIGIREHSWFSPKMPRSWDTRVLIVPPPHGDLGNPDGPTAQDYLHAAVSGIQEWVDVLDRFGKQYTEFAFLSQVGVDIILWDDTMEESPHVDIVIAFIPSAGAQFRGVASTCADWVRPTVPTIGRVDGPRCIALSLFGMAPRSGQTVPDYPEYNDMEAVVKHEFAHVWGIGHTLTWTQEHGPDLMNSPFAIVYGDGDPLDDGGARTPKICISSLNAYGVALMFEWLETGQRPDETWDPTYTLPSHIPYEWYC